MGNTLGFRVVFKQVAKDVACIAIEEAVFSEISKIASGDYVFSDGDIKGIPYAGKTNNFTIRDYSHSDRIREMLVRVEIQAENILDLFNVKDEKKGLDNALRAIEQSFMDFLKKKRL